MSRRVSYAIEQHIHEIDRELEAKPLPSMRKQLQAAKVWLRKALESAKDIERTNLEESKYNGWTNHATWHTAMDVEGEDDVVAGNLTSRSEAYEYTGQFADYLREVADQIVESNPDFAETRAGWWLDYVNFYEIAEGMVKEYPQLLQENWPEEEGHWEQRDYQWVFVPDEEDDDDS